MVEAIGYEDIYINVHIEFTTELHVDRSKPSKLISKKNTIAILLYSEIFKIITQIIMFVYIWH